MISHKILVADVGGSHITVGSFRPNPSGFGFDRLERRDVDSSGSQQQIIETWADCMRTFIDDSDPVRIGIAFPAPFDYENGICLIEEQGKFGNLFQKNIKQALAEKLDLQTAQIEFINDAEAFLVGESFFGLGRGVDNVLGLTLGSGLGSSLKIKESITDAALWSSPFQSGVAEDYLGTGWFVNWVKKELGIKVSGVKDLVENSKFDNKRKLVFDIFSRNLADFIEIQTQANDLQLVIIGGNISRAHPHFLPHTLDLLKNRNVNIDLKISELGENSALMGAAALFLKNGQLEELRAV